MTADPPMRIVAMVSLRARRKHRDRSALRQSPRSTAANRTQTNIPRVRATMTQDDRKGFRVTRRLMLEAGTAAAAISFVGESQLARGAGLTKAEAPPEPMTVVIQINGRPRTLTLDPRTTLLDALREHTGLTGIRLVAKPESVTVPNLPPVQ